MGNIYFAWSFYIYQTKNLPSWFNGNWVGIDILKVLEENWIDAYIWTIYWSYTTMVCKLYFI